MKLSPQNELHKFRAANGYERGCTYEECTKFRKMMKNGEKLPKGIALDEGGYNFIEFNFPGKLTIEEAAELLEWRKLKALRGVLVCAVIVAVIMLLSLIFTVISAVSIASIF